MQRKFRRSPEKETYGFGDDPESKWDNSLPPPISVDKAISAESFGVIESRIRDGDHIGQQGLAGWGDHGAYAEGDSDVMFSHTNGFTFDGFPQPLRQLAQLSLDCFRHNDQKFFASITSDGIVWA